MSVLSWLKQKLFGINGYDPVKHETQVKRRKDQVQDCMDATSTNFKKAGRAFDGVELGIPSIEMTPSDEHPCLGESDGE